MKIRRGMAAGAGIVSAVALGIALQSEEPAHAVAPPADGNYSFSQAGVSGVSWTISALCIQVNGSRYYKDYANPDIMADFCSLNIVSSMSRAPVSRADRLQNFSGRARLVNGLWTFDIKAAEGVSCPGGGTAPSTETYAFDDETLAGTQTTLHDAVCGLQPEMSKKPFSLQMAGAAPSPIERYPLQCNDLAMCF